MADQNDKNSDDSHGQVKFKPYKVKSFESSFATSLMADVIMVHSFQAEDSAMQPLNTTNGAMSEKSQMDRTIADPAPVENAQSARVPPKIVVSPTQDLGESSVSHTPGSRIQHLLAKNIKPLTRRALDSGRILTQDWIKDRSLNAQKLANQLKTARVLLFEYPEGNLKRESLMPSANEIAKQCVQWISSKRETCPDRPIVFIGDQFGAIIIEKCLMQCGEDDELCSNIVLSTAGITMLQASEIPVELSGSYSKARDNWLQAQTDSADKWNVFDRLELMRTDRRMHRQPLYKTQEITTQGRTVGQRSIRPELEHTQQSPAILEPGCRMPSSRWEPNSSQCSKSYKDICMWHSEKFKDLYEWHADWRPAMILDRFLLNGPRAYINAINAIQKSVRAYRLLDMARSGNAARMTELLRQFENEKVNFRELKDGMSRSALHVSVRDGRLGIINVLAERGDATFFSMQDNNGRNALHYATRYCQNRKRLSRLVDILVRKGVTLDAVDNDGVSAEAAATARGVHPKLLQQFPGPSREVEEPSLPQKPTGLAKSSCKGFRATLAEFRKTTDGVEQVFIQQPSIHELLYGDEDGGPERFFQLAQCEALDRQESSLDAPQFRWYHIPVNHVGWIKDLFARMKVVTDPVEHDQYDGKKYWSRNMRPQARNFEYKQFVKDSDKPAASDSSGRTLREEGVKDFVLFIPYLNFERRAILLGLQGVADEASLQQDTTVGEAQERSPERWASMDGAISPVTEAGYSSGGGESPVSAPTTTLSTPNFSDQDSVEDDIGVWSLNPAERKMRFAITPSGDSPDPLDLEKNLVKSYLSKDSSVLHQRRTLDQSHYVMLDDTSDRDKDQVVLRRQLKLDLGQRLDLDKDFNQSQKDALRLVMVDQLWIWVIDDTIVTSFPQKWRTKDSKRECDVLDELLRHLKDSSRPCIPTVHDFADVIIKFCASVFNKPEPRAELSLHSLFEESVGEVADQQMQLFRQFEDEFSLFSESRKNNTRSMDKMFAIEADINLLDEVRDIRDELRMILRVLNDQAMAVKDMLAIIDQGESSRVSPVTGVEAGRQVDTAQNDSQPTQRGNRSRSSPWRRQGRIEELFKKKHGAINANVRDFTRMLAHADNSYEEANTLLDLKQKQLNVLEARAARKGANTILVFTLATIFFGGLSFVTAFFALNVAAFPHRGDITVWKLSHIIGIIAGFAFSLTLPFVGAAIWINSLVHEAVQIFKRVSRWIRSEASTGDRHNRGRMDTVQESNLISKNTASR